MIYTLDIGSPSSHWIGYQALAGIGIGLSIQVPIIANQSFVKVSEISSITAVTLCKYIVVGDELIITNKSSSLPNNWRCLLRLSRSSRLHQSIARARSGSRTRRQPRLGGSNRCNPIARSIFSRTTSWHRARIHGRTEAVLCVSNRLGWSYHAHCIVCKMAKCQTEGSRSGCVEVLQQ